MSFKNLAFIAAVMVSTPALADNADFVLANATGYPIAELYVSPAHADTWGPDVLGKHVIAHGDAWKITFPRSNSVCVQDIRIVFEDDGSKVTWQDVDLCEINKLTLTYNRSTGVTTAVKE